MVTKQRKIGLVVATFSLLLFISLIFIKIDLDKRDSYLCGLIHTNPDINMAECPAHISNTSWLLVGAFGFAFLILGLSLYLIFISDGPLSFNEVQEERKTASIASEEPNTQNLDEEEQKIYNLLTINQGSMYQSDLIKETNYTKVHMTRILDKMEGKRILERKRRGMTNIVVLK